MRVNEDYKEWNVEAQLIDEGSVLNFWKKLLRIRKAYDVLVSLGLSFGFQVILLRWRVVFGSARVSDLIVKRVHLANFQLILTFVCPW